MNIQYLPSVYENEDALLIDEHMHSGKSYSVYQYIVGHFNHILGTLIICGVAWLKLKCIMQLRKVIVIITNIIFWICNLVE